MSTEEEEIEVEQPPKPQQYEKIKHSPMKDPDGWTVLSASANAAGMISLATIIAEVLTDGWLAQKVGFGFYLSTPLGFGATFLTVLVARNRGLRHARIPATFVFLYWALYFGSVLMR